jgi:lysosomal acid lipase/cholesteryl ester hydrolase
MDQRQLAVRHPTRSHRHPLPPETRHKLVLPQITRPLPTLCPPQFLHTSGQAPCRSHAQSRSFHFEYLCAIFGYHNVEEHVVLTKDGYLLRIHRVPGPRSEPRAVPGSSTGKLVYVLHHGLLINSEVCVCLTSPERSVPFVLAELGYDVWLGNNRGNKYSKKSIHHDPNSLKFWDFSIDDFAWHDIPDLMEHILQITRASSLGYVSFSQDTSPAFAALSIHPQLNQKVNAFIVLAPAMRPRGLSALLLMVS